MTSSTVTGDRRWTSARRGGMTVLGKVAVPKPINLPSQRLENHGLDPSVEIVPKGTLSWGSRSSSSSTNAWGSSTLSPHADGGGGSPSHLSARPSSGGSGTRPSTAGSDRSHEPNTWGSNSRPSSASGTLTINQTQAATLRPCSAETRPGSAQLSRFAEPHSESSLARGAAGINEKLGVESSKNDGFSLTSGDFPTLGSEKEISGKNTESQDHGVHGRPGSSSGIAPVKEGAGTSPSGDVPVNVNVKGGASNSWRRDHPPYGEEGIRPNVEKWQPDLQPYPNPNIPPQHYDAWRGPPVNDHPPGVWYRGPPGGPPYGSPVPPGGFLMEPFPYFRPQIPATALPNPQPIPPAGAGPRGPHPKSGDVYRPHMADHYIRPGMPMRPGFYSGPMPYEGYYGPPMGYCNSNERDIPFMGMPAGPSAYNRYRGQNAHDTSNPHGRPTGHTGAGKPLPPEQVESGHPHDARGQFKVLLKHHDGWDGKDEGKRWEDHVTSNAYVDNSDQPRASWDDDWRTDHKKDEEMEFRRRSHIEEASHQKFYHKGGSSSVRQYSPDSNENLKVPDEVSVKNNEHVASEFLEVPAAHHDTSLIQKIEGLNAKARAADGQQEVLFVSSREEQRNKSHIDAKGNHSVNECTTGPVHFERIHSSKTNDTYAQKVGATTADRSLESTVTGGAVMSRRSAHGVHGKLDNRHKSRFPTEDVDGWRKKSPVTDSSGNLSTSRSESSNVPMPDLKAMEDERSSRPIFDPSDAQAQRAKMAELTKQRAKQRQMEEEERTREQKAKALAKLEELNRRTQVTELSNQESVTVLSAQNKLVESRTVAAPPPAGGKLDTSSFGSVSDSSAAANTITGCINTIGSTVFVGQTPIMLHGLSVPLKQEVHSADAAALGNAAQVQDQGSSKQKHVSYKQKPNNLDTSASTNSAEASKSRPDIVGNVSMTSYSATEVAPSSGPVTTGVEPESTVPHRKRNNRSSKNKQKVDGASSTASLPLVTFQETTLNNTADSGNSMTTESALDMGFVHPLASSNDANQSSEQLSPTVNEDVHARASNQWKSQHSRRPSRSTQANKATEKFHGADAVVWAPVRTQNRNEVTEETCPKSIPEGATPSLSADQVQHHTRNKRAEMERYVPKPVAKEMAQQGNSQQSVVSLSTSVETAGRDASEFKGSNNSAQASSGIGKAGAFMDSSNGEGRQNKQGKESWRQRGSESTTMHVVKDAQSSQPNRNVQRSIQHSHPQKPASNSVKERPRSSDGWNASEDWNVPSGSDSAAPSLVPAVQDQGVTGRGKRHAFKGHKGTGSNQDSAHKKISSSNTDKISTQDAVPEINQTALPNASKESRAVGERLATHWQPKSQASLGSNQRASRANGGQTVGAEISGPHKMDSNYLGGVPHQSQQDRGTKENLTQVHHNPSMFEENRVEEASNSGVQETRRERKIASPRGQSRSTNHSTHSNVEQSPLEVDTHLEHRPSSGHRKNGNQNSRFGRGQDCHGDWNSSGQDNKQHNQPANRERQRHNPHYEYQPVGSQNTGRANNYEGSKDNSYNSGSGFRARGQSHSRHGATRQSGNVRVDSSYE